jgi:hypothetical protein
VVDRARLRLRPPVAGQPYTFEQRAVDGNWREAPWLPSGQVALDEWHEVVLRDRILWAATPAGIVSFDYTPGGQALLNPDTVHLVRKPAGGQGECEVTEMELQDQRLLLRCNMDAKRVFQGALSDQADTNVFTPLAGGDPFAERELVSEATSGYWQWRLHGRAGGNPGSLQMRLHGEEQDLFDGRFDFDTLNSLALFADSLLEIGTDRGGWFRSPLDTLHPRGLQRTSVAGLDPGQFNRVQINFASGQHTLCLQTIQGYFVRLAPDDRHEQLAHCLEYLADEPLWRYERDGQQLVVTAPASIGGAAQRQLVRGRFGDDTLTGPPVTGSDEAGIFYLWPTYAAIFRLDQNLAVTHIYGPNFPGLSEGATPGALFLTATGTPVYAGASFLYTLEEPRTPLATASLAGPEGAVPVEAFDGAYDSIAVRWQASPARSWNLLRPGDAEFLLRDGLQVHVAAFDRFNQKRVRWGDPPPWLEMRFEAAWIDVYWAGAQQRYPIILPVDFTLLKPILAGNRLILIGDHEILEVNLERAMVGAFEAR